MILVDSTVWIDLLRKKEGQHIERLKELLIFHNAAIAPVIFQEILQGGKSPEDFTRLRDYFITLPFLYSFDSVLTYEKAGELYARCRWKGITPRSPHDCLIAQIAIEHDVPLLHDDRDFLAIASIDPKLQIDPCSLAYRCRN